MLDNCSFSSSLTHLPVSFYVSVTCFTTKNFTLSSLFIKLSTLAVSYFRHCPWKSKTLVYFALTMTFIFPSIYPLGFSKVRTTFSLEGFCPFLNFLISNFLMTSNGFSYLNFMMSFSGMVLNYFCYFYIRPLLASDDDLSSKFS
jgi:hypothetical protein